MGKLLDRFENFVLNYARRIISAFMGVALLAAGLLFFSSILNAIDSPSLAKDDPFQMPRFEEPADAVVPVQTEQTGSQPESDVGAVPGDDEDHPMPRYRKEFGELLDALIPLYASLQGFLDMSAEDPIGQARNQLEKFLTGQLVEYQSTLSDQQMDFLMSQLVVYQQDASEYYRKEYEISEDVSLDGPKVARLGDGSPISDYLNNPVRAFLTEVQSGYADHLDVVVAAENEAAENNSQALEQLMAVGAAMSAFLAALILLLVFKAENSLRRSADALEAEGAKTE